MKNRIIKTLLCFFIVILLENTFIFNNEKINTTRSNKFENNQISSKKVSDRTLAIAAAMAYMPKPVSCDIYKNKPCHFSDRQETVDIINQVTNLHTYADSKELDDWEIVDDINIKTTIANLSAIFTAYTLKNDKTKDIIILYRGTDFTDLLEWLQHLTYATNDIHAQESLAEEYVLKQAKKYKDYNIYITGHSLGGYLTTIAGSALQKAINNGINNSTDWEGFNLSKKNYNLNEIIGENFYDYKDINFVEAVSFNGMGLLFNYVNNEINVQNKKIDVITNSENNIFGESKFITYSVKGDLVSSFGIHFGEFRQIDAAIDSVGLHKNTYNFLSSLEAANAVQSVITAEKNIKLVNNSIKLIFSKSNYNFSNTSSFFNDHIKEDIINDYKYYDMNSIIGYLNLTHESDQFGCLLDNTITGNVKLIEEKPGFMSNQMTLIKSYINENQSNQIISNKNVNTTLRAMSYNGCARKYIWYECEDKEKNKCKIINISSLNSTNKDNTIQVKTSNKIRYYYAKTYYDDSYKLLKIKKDENNNYKNMEEKINHIRKVVNSQTFKIISDTEEPKCTFKDKELNVSLKKKLFTYEKKEVSTIITCTDNLTGFKTGIKKVQFYEKNDGIIPSFNVKNIKILSQSDNKIEAKVTLEINRVPLFLKPELVFNLLQDKVGNIVKPIKLKLNITKK